MSWRGSWTARKSCGRSARASSPPSGQTGPDAGGRARRAGRAGRARAPAAPTALDLCADPELARLLERGRADRDVPRGDPVRLEEDDVVVGLAARELSRDDLLELVYLEPVEHPGSNRLDQVSRLEPRLLDRVAADERGPLEDDVVQLA